MLPTVSQPIITTDAHIERPCGSVDQNFDKSSCNDDYGADSSVGFDINDNAVGSTISSVTDWNDYCTAAVPTHATSHDHSFDVQRSSKTKLKFQENILSQKIDDETKCQEGNAAKGRKKGVTEQMMVGSSLNHESSIETWWNPSHGNRRSLQSAAEINSRGTLSLEKNDHSVLPKTWMDAVHGENDSIMSRKEGNNKSFSLGAASISSAKRSESDDASSEFTFEEDGGEFPCQQVIDGSFPKTASRVNKEPSEESVRFGNNDCGFECVIDDCSDSSMDDLTDVTAEPKDWSHIGTVIDEKSSISQSSIPIIAKTISEESKISGSSLNRFISDLVWLEKKISDENDASKEREAVELTINDFGTKENDSFSYECDAFSPRSLCYEDDTTTITSKANSQTMSIACRDCYIPPGHIAIEIISTKDGPMIKSVGGRSMEDHLNAGDLIIAVDDQDTRSLSAEQVMSALSSRSKYERKLTVLQFGGAV